jgi:hypothetical protein
MPWENIEERLKKAFSIRISFPEGIISIPPNRLDIDSWLTSAAETDEELRELNIPRFRFLQNRWRIEELVQIEWEGQSSVTRRAVSVMYMGRRAYLLFSGGYKYHLLAAIEPADKPALYHAVIRRLLTNVDLVPTAPTHIRNLRPDLVTDLNEQSKNDLQSVEPSAKKGYLSNLLVGWIGPWIDLPVLGYWHVDDEPQPHETIGTRDSSNRS